MVGCFILCAAEVRSCEAAHDACSVESFSRPHDPPSNSAASWREKPTGQRWIALGQLPSKYLHPNGTETTFQLLHQRDASRLPDQRHAWWNTLKHFIDPPPP